MVIRLSAMLMSGVRSPGGQAPISDFSSSAGRFPDPGRRPFYRGSKEKKWIDGFKVDIKFWGTTGNALGDAMKPSTCGATNTRRTHRIQNAVLDIIGQMV